MRSRAAHAGLLVIALLPAPASAESQTPPKTARIGMLSLLSAAGAAPNEKAFRDALPDLGYVEGQSVVIDARYADGQAERLPALAADLVRSPAPRASAQSPRGSRRRRRTRCRGVRESARR